MINDGLLGCECQEELNEEQAMFLISLLRSENDKDASKSELTKTMSADPGSKIIRSRLEAAGGKATDELIIWLSYISKGVPGTMVMWAYTTACIQQKVEQESVTLNDWTTWFPEGLPSNGERARVWDSQKVKREPGTMMSDNAYDNLDYWPRLRFCTG